MSYKVRVQVWGPEKGCELVIGAKPEEAFEAVRDCVQPRLDVSLPGALVKGALVTREERVEDGQICPGYRLIVKIGVSSHEGPDDSGYERWLQGWVESEVSVMLLDLLNPILVEMVSVMRSGAEVARPVDSADPTSR